MIGLQRTIGLGFGSVAGNPAYVGTIAAVMPDFEAAVTMTVFAAGTIVGTIAAVMPDFDGAVTAKRIRYPVDAITSKNWRFFYDTAKGVTQSGGVLSAIADQSSAGHDGSSSSTFQPAVTSSDSTFANQQTVTGDGTDDAIGTGWTPPAPGTTPTFMLGVFKPITWTNGDALCGTAASVMSLSQATGSPQIFQRNTTAVNSNSAGALGSWKRFYALWNNATSDRLQIGSTNVTGANAGNTAPAAQLCLLARGSTGASAANVAFRWWGALDGEPTSDEKTEFDDYVNAISGMTLT